MTGQRTLNMNFGENQQDQRSIAASEDTQNQQSPTSPTHADQQNPNADEDFSANRYSDQQFRDQLLRVDLKRLQAIGNEAIGGDAGGTVGDLMDQRPMAYQQQKTNANPALNNYHSAPNFLQKSTNFPHFNGIPQPPPGFMWSLVPVNANTGQNTQPAGYGDADIRQYASQHCHRPYMGDEPDEFCDDQRLHGRCSALDEYRVRSDDHANTGFEYESRHRDYFSAQAMKSLDGFSYAMTLNTLPNLKGNIGIDAIKIFFKQFDVATEEWPDRKRLSALESKCSGRAERAFNAAVANYPYRYESIKRAMVQQLEETDAKQMGAFDELMAGVQRGANESIDDLADRVAALVHRAYPGLTHHLYDEYSVKHLIRSLSNPELALSLELSRREGCSFDEFVALAARAEATQRAARNNARARFWPNSHENTNPFVSSKIVCYNCGQPGHLSRHCEVPRRDHRGAIGQDYTGYPPSTGETSTQVSSGINGQQNFGQQNKPQMSSRNHLRQNFLVEQDVASPIRDELLAGAINSEFSSEMNKLFDKSNNNKEVQSSELDHGKGPLMGKLMTLKVAVYGESTNAMLDGGAQISLISAAFYLRLVREGKVNKSAISISDSGRRVVDINGQNMDYYGVVSIPISRGSQFARILMHVTKAPFGYDLLFGINAFDQLGFKLFNALSQKIIDFGVKADESNPITAHVIYSMKISPANRPCGKRKMAAPIPNSEPNYAVIDEHKKDIKKEKRKRQKERRKLRKFESLKSDSGKREEERKNRNWEESSRTATNRLRTIEFSGCGVKAQMPTKPDDREGICTVRCNYFTRGRAELSLGDCPCQGADLDLGFRRRLAFRRSGLGLDDRPCPVHQCLSKTSAEDPVERVSVRGASGTRLCSPPTFRMPNRVWRPNRVT